MQKRFAWSLWCLALALVMGPMTCGYAVAQDDDDKKADVAKSSKDNDDKEEKDEELSPADQFKALQKEATKTQREFSKKMRSAGRDREKAMEVFEAMNKAMEDFAGQGLAMVDTLEDKDLIGEVLVWVAQNSRGECATKAKDKLVEGYIESELMADCLQSRIFAMPSEDNEKILRAIIEKNPSNDAKGLATYSLYNHFNMVGRYKSLPAATLKQAGMDADYISDAASKAGDETIKLLEEISENYADVEIRGRKLGDMAEAALFSAKYLQIGKECPDIEGKDLDGVEFKLSDYRGKVVVIDFWADW